MPGPSYQFSPDTMSRRPSRLMSATAAVSLAPPSSMRIRNGISGGLAAEIDSNPRGRHHHDRRDPANHRHSHPHEMPALAASGPGAYARDGWPAKQFSGVAASFRHDKRQDRRALPQAEVLPGPAARCAVSQNQTKSGLQSLECFPGREAYAVAAAAVTPVLALPSPAWASRKRAEC